MIGRLAPEQGYSLIETVAVLAIFGTVMGSLTTLFVAGTNAEVDMNERFQAQQATRLALSKLRRDIHCADGVVTYTTSSVTLNLPTYCKSGSGPISWCAVTVSGVAGLYRRASSTCDATGVRWAKGLVSTTVFPTWEPQSDDSLAKLHVRIQVDVDPSDGRAVYRLDDALVLRNTTRSTQ